MRNAKEEKQLKAFGKRLAALRRERGFTQQTFAEKLNTQVLTVAFWETGRRWPRLATLHDIAHALDIPLNELFDGLKR